MSKIIITFLISFLLFSYANADEIDIRANHFYADDITKLAYFEGNATITQGSNIFQASKVIVHFNKHKKALKYEAKGNVFFDLVERGIHYRGRAGHITYAPNASKYYFEHNVVLEDLTNNRKIMAERITLDLKTGRADIKGTNSKPVYFRFEIEDRK